MRREKRRERERAWHGQFIVDDGMVQVGVCCESDRFLVLGLPSCTCQVPPRTVTSSSSPLPRVVRCCRGSQFNPSQSKPVQYTTQCCIASLLGEGADASLNFQLPIWLELRRRAPAPASASGLPSFGFRTLAGCLSSHPTVTDFRTLGKAAPQVQSAFLTSDQTNGHDEGCFAHTRLYSTGASGFREMAVTVTRRSHWQPAVTPPWRIWTVQVEARCSEKDRNRTPQDCMDCYGTACALLACLARQGRDESRLLLFQSFSPVCLSSISTTVHRQTRDLIERERTDVGRGTRRSRGYGGQARLCITPVRPMRVHRAAACTRRLQHGCLQSMQATR